MIELAKKEGREERVRAKVLSQELAKRDIKKTQKAIQTEPNDMLQRAVSSLETITKQPFFANDMQMIQKLFKNSLDSQHCGLKCAS